MCRRSLATTIFLFLYLTVSAHAAPGVIARVPNPVPGEYIVLFGKNVSAIAAAPALAAAGGTVVIAFPEINAYYVRNMSDAAALALPRNPNVSSVEENAIIDVAGTAYGLDTPLTTGENGQVNASRWGLDRLDQNYWRSIPRLDNTYTWCYTGSGVRIYILDTGVMSNHPEFDGAYYHECDGTGRVDCASAWQTYRENTLQIDLGVMSQHVVL